MYKAKVIRRSFYWGYMVVCGNCNGRFGVGVIPKEIEKCPRCEQIVEIEDPRNWVEEWDGISEIEYMILEGAKR